MTERGAWGETERGLEPQTTERSETCRVPVAFPARPTVTRNRMNNGMFTRNQRLLGDQEVLCRRCSSESCASAPAWWDAMKERPNSVEGRNTMSRMSQCRWDVLCLPVVSDLIHYILPTWNQFTSFFRIVMPLCAVFVMNNRSSGGRNAALWYMSIFAAFCKLSQLPDVVNVRGTVCWICNAWW